MGERQDRIVVAVEDERRNAQPAQRFEPVRRSRDREPVVLRRVDVAGARENAGFASADRRFVKRLTPPRERARHSATAASMRSSGVRGGLASCCANAASKRGCGASSPPPGEPMRAETRAPNGDDITELSVRTRGACSSASVCPIMPPIEAPTT